MRDRRFVAEHRGGPLKMEQHRQLMLWACHCVEHVLESCDLSSEKRVLLALGIGKAWVIGQASVGDARKASVDMLALARALTNPVQIALVRATGHAVATAHMADHSMGAALYALKSVNCARKSIKEEWEWQMDKLPLEVKDFVPEVMSQKARSFKMH
jgi:hypothetical protein